MHSDSLLEPCSDLELGTTHVAVGASHALREEINALDAKINQRAFILIPLPDGIAPTELADHLLEQLAATALGLWPNWYDSRIDAPSCGSSSMELTSLAASARSAGARYREVNLSWLLDAARLAHAGRAPIVPRVATTVQLSQLTKAISPTGTTIFLTGIWPDGPSADALGRQVENLAPIAQAAIVVLTEDENLPAALARFPVLALSHSPMTRTWPAEASTSVFGPIIGSPHPNSEAELKLHRSISRAEDLRGLFRWNQFVHVSPAVTPKVDLVWPEGKLVVEIDGWADHSSREKFESDRQRDYELIASGYLVLRISNSEVLTDTERVLEKLRRVVQLRETIREQWSLSGAG